jgi:hypothetical protein
MMLYTKTKHHIFLTVLLILALAVVACDSGDGGGQESGSKATQPPAAQATQSTTEDTTTGEQPTKPPAGPTGKTGLFADPQESLDSYRMRTTMVLKEGEGLLGEEMITEIEWVRSPEALHMTMYGASGEVMMESIKIGDDNWLSMGDGSWLHTTVGATGEESSLQDTQADLEDILEGMESSMKEVGKDEVDGVRCKRYAVDTDFDMSLPIPEDIPAEARQLLPTEMQGNVEGEICVADESGLPEVIVRSQTTQEITLKYASGKEETSVYEEDRELYDINEPIAIEPPEGAMEIPGMPAPPEGLPTELPGGEVTLPTEGNGVSVETASLTELDSYRAEVTHTVNTGDAVVIVSVTEEWVREPYARHIVTNAGEGMPAFEYTIVGDSAWMKMGDSWLSIAPEEVQDADDQWLEISSADSEMVPLGEETVNDIRCQHYIFELNMASQSVRHEIWVADQSDLPPVVVRATYWTELKTGQTTIVNEGEGNVYDINTPITIEPPQ